METIRIGIVGAGERGCYVLGSRIIEMAQELDLRITALCDINSQRIIDATDYLTSQAKVHQPYLGARDHGNHRLSCTHR